MENIGSILFSSPALLILTALLPALHVISFFLKGKPWMSIINLLGHIAAIFASLLLRATMIDLLILLLLSSAVCLTLRLIRRENK